MEKLLKLLKEIRPDVDFDTEKSLVGAEVLDSLDIMEIVAEISDTFDIELSPADIIPVNFDSAEAMWALIQKKK